jgi:hypothetical protein
MILLVLLIRHRRRDDSRNGGNDTGIQATLRLGGAVLRPNGANWLYELNFL